MHTNSNLFFRNEKPQTQRCPFAIQILPFKHTHQWKNKPFFRTHSLSETKNAPSKCYNLVIFPTQQVGPRYFFFNIKNVMSAGCILQQPQ